MVSHQRTSPRAPAVADMAALVEASWAENVEPGFAHDLAALRALGAGTPEVDALTATIEDDGRLVALALGLPRDAFLLGERCRVSLVTEVTVASGQKGRGLGRAVLAAALSRARDAGCDAALWYAVPGSPMDRASAPGVRDAGLEPILVTQLSFLRGIPRAGEPCDAGGDAAVALAILDDDWRGRAGAADLARTGGADEARRAVTGSDAIAASLGAGAVVGRMVRMSGRDALSCLVVDESCWGPLDAPSRLALVRRTLSLAASRGARLCSVAMTVQDPAPWREAGLRLSPRRMNAWLASWRPLPRAPSTILFDVS